MAHLDVQFYLDVDTFMKDVKCRFFYKDEQVFLRRKAMMQFFNHSGFFRLHHKNTRESNKNSFCDIKIPDDYCDHIDTFLILCGLAPGNIKACDIHIPKFLMLCSHFMITDDFIVEILNTIKFKKAVNKTIIKALYLCIKHFNFKKLYSMLATDQGLILDNLPHPNEVSFGVYKKKLRSVIRSNYRFSQSKSKLLWDPHKECRTLYCKPNCVLCNFEYNKAQIETLEEQKLEFAIYKFEFFTEHNCAPGCKIYYQKQNIEEEEERRQVVPMEHQKHSTLSQKIEEQYCT